MMTYICPFCHSELIFTGKRTDTNVFNDLNACFYACKCGNNIVSDAFKNKDGTPKIFYDNTWSHRINGAWYFYDSHNKVDVFLKYGNGWGTPKETPTELKKYRVKVVYT